jgi:hypothetical protein
VRRRVLRVRAPARLKVSDNRRFLVSENGKPFFCLADTAWAIFDRLDRKQAVEYLTVRAAQQFTVIQAVAISLFDADVRNAQGDLPLIDRDPARPAVTPGADPADALAYDFWDHVEYIIDEANARGLYVAMLPAWGSAVNRSAKNPAKEPILNAKSAHLYGEFLGRRFGRKGIVWVLGGDRSASGYEDVWRALAKGIAIGVSGRENYDAVLMTYHPAAGETSSAWFHNEPWLDFNMHQTGHDPNEKTMSWSRIANDYALSPAKPVLDGEPLYEDTPLSFRSREHGYSLEPQVRQRAWWNVFAGACGHAYGHQSVWQMFAPGRRPVFGPLFDWSEGVHRPVASQMRHVRALVESRPYLSRVPDQSLVEQELAGADHIAATRGDGYAFIYGPQGRGFTLRLSKIGAQRLQA